MNGKENSKDKLLKTASKLFQMQGYHATGLNQITKESGAPKGSLYYHFPDGKEELAVEAVKLTSQIIGERIKVGLDGYDDSVAAIQNLIITMAKGFFQGGNTEGVPIATVALETSVMSELLRETCNSAYLSWEKLFANKMEKSGFPPDKALELSIVINAMIEGAFILSLTRRNSEPLLMVAKQVPFLLKK
ncbi:MAG: TetR/AcrR family transcriptional regulator [Bacillus sp. (in: Bacteria)]|nr:TetR/AcrR family transcriptional regulator [Bacillus sp. (in: firmicutes)]